MFHLIVSRSAALLLLLGIGSVLVVVVVFRGSAAAAPEAAPAAADPLPTYTVTSATRTVPVRGVVTAAATLPVRAERGGVITELPVTEGDRVAAGAVLARQQRPVATADLARREAELSAARARGVIATTDASSSAAITAVRTVEAASLATIRQRGANAKLEREVAAVYSALQSSLTTLADAASFLDANRSRVAADELRDFEAALAVVYGAVPERFTSGVRRPLPDTVTDLRRAVTALGAADTDPIRALELGRASEAALAEFSELLSMTEAEFLDDAGDRKSTRLNSSHYS